jgi:hypothetical protein
MTDQRKLQRRRQRRYQHHALVQCDFSIRNDVQRDMEMASSTHMKMKLHAYHAMYALKSWGKE